MKFANKGQDLNVAACK